MMRLGVLGSMLWVTVGLCGCVEDEVEQRTTLRSCDGNHESTLHVMRDLDGAKRAIALGNDGYVLFGGGIFGSGLVKVDADGELLAQIPNPSDVVPMISDVAGFEDGSLVLAGLKQDIFANELPHAWVGRLDSGGALDWELELGPQPAQFVVIRGLPDGDSIVARMGLASPSALPEGEDVSSADESGVVSWMRISGTGGMLWERSVSFDRAVTYFNGAYGAPQLALNLGETLSLIVQTQAGLVLITSDLEGENQEQTLLATRLAGGLVGSAALSDGGLAILSQRAAAVLTLVDRDGAVLSEHTYGRMQGAEPGGLGYDALREELIIGGSFRGDDRHAQRTWMIGVDLAGEQRWSIHRDPIDIRYPDGNIDHVEPGQGPDLTDLAVSPIGRFLATGSSTFELSYFTVDPEGCP